MMIWSGHGYLVPVIVCVCSVLLEFVMEGGTIDGQSYQQSIWGYSLALIVAAGIIYAVDRLVLVGSDEHHSWFFIPLIWWTPIVAFVSVIVLIYRVANGA